MRRVARQLLFRPSAAGAATTTAVRPVARAHAMGTGRRGFAAAAAARAVAAVNNAGGAGKAERTLVTGAFGCIGSHVIRRLMADGQQPVAMDAGTDPWRLYMICGGADAVARAGVEVVTGADIRDLDGLKRAVQRSGATRIIHLAAWQVPLCRADPATGAAVNVVGTANVFEAARAAKAQVKRITYFSSAAVFGSAAQYPPGPLTDRSARLPATHYGVYKVANEDLAAVYWAEHGIPSIGFRPLTVYGPARDFGVTADPTLAVKAALLGRPFTIRFGGSTDFIYVDDVATAVLRANASHATHSHAYNLHGESASVQLFVDLIAHALPAVNVKQLISVTGSALPFPDGMTDDGYQRLLGPAPRTSLADGVRKTVADFQALQRAGRFDARELNPPK